MYGAGKFRAHPSSPLSDSLTMARPRVFISSTYYDLKSIREDLDRFIRAVGYEAIRHEMGHIAYGNEDRPEAYAYREIESCDILISIIGGKFGTQAAGSDYSISQKELKKAFDIGKQVYIFVEKSVHSEFGYYKVNKDVPGVRFTAVNDPKVYAFLEEIYLLPKGNPIFSFDTGMEITEILREQWAALFQRLLLQQMSKSQTSLTEELQRSLQTVDQLVKFLTQEKTKGSAEVSELLLSNHPIFEAVRNTVKNKYRLYFTNLEEFNRWADAARGFSPVKESDWDSPYYREWVRDYETKDKKEIELLFIKNDLFDQNGQLRLVGASEWQEDWVRIERRSKPGRVPQSDELPSNPS